MNNLTMDIKKLCIANGIAIDKVAKKYNVNQDIVAKLYMETMKSILLRMETERR